MIMQSLGAVVLGATLAIAAPQARAVSLSVESDDATLTAPDTFTIAPNGSGRFYLNVGALADIVALPDVPEDAILFVDLRFGVTQSGGAPADSLFSVKGVDDFSTMPFYPASPATVLGTDDCGGGTTFPCEFSYNVLSAVPLPAAPDGPVRIAAIDVVHERVGPVPGPGPDAAGFAFAVLSASVDVLRFEEGGTLNSLYASSSFPGVAATFTVSAIPEPSMLVLAASGLSLLLAGRLLRRAVRGAAALQ